MSLQHLLQQSGVGDGLRRKEGPFQLGGVQVEVAPLAGGAGVRPGGVQDVPGNDGHVPGVEGPFLPLEGQDPPVAFAQPDFQAVVKVQHSRRFV